jgi:hypothetical protein
MGEDAASPHQGTRAYRLQRTQAVASIATVVLAFGSFVLQVDGNLLPRQVLNADWPTSPDMSSAVVAINESAMRLHHYPSGQLVAEYEDRVEILLPPS